MWLDNKTGLMVHVLHLQLCVKMLSFNKNSHLFGTPKLNVIASSPVAV